jgi:hypothetical protein
MFSVVNCLIFTKLMIEVSSVTFCAETGAYNHSIKRWQRAARFRSEADGGDDGVDGDDGLSWPHMCGAEE